MTDFFTAISNFGFPVVVAGYLLFRFENKIEKLDDAICGKDGLIQQIRLLDSTVKTLVEKIDNRNK